MARAEEVLRGETGEDFELADLVRDLAAPEFVARLWGHPVPGGEPPRASLPWLRPRQARFALHPALPVFVGALLVAAVAALIRRPWSWSSP